MGTKKKTSWAEAVNDAVTGYSVVVLSVICFLLALALIVAGIRMIAGPAPAAATATTSSAASVSTTATGRTA